jgi:hypothetical protein
MIDIVPHGTSDLLTPLSDPTERAAETERACIDEQRGYICTIMT